MDVDDREEMEGETSVLGRRSNRNTGNPTDPNKTPELNVTWILDFKYFQLNRGILISMLANSHNRHLLLRHRQILLTLLKQCNSITTLKKIHSYMLTSSTRKDNHLLSKAIQLKDFTYATQLFSQISSPNDYSYNIIIRAMTTTWNDYPLAIQFYLDMIRTGVRCNHFTYPFVLIAFANLRWPCSGRTTHASVFKDGLHLDPHTQHCLITMYARCGLIVCARRVFDDILYRDSVSWNSMISGYAKMGFANEAVYLFEGMKSAGFDPDEMTLVSVLMACGDLSDLVLGKSLEEIVKDRGFELTSFLSSALIVMYSRCGDLESARRIFDSLHQKEMVAWNSMITGYSQNGRSNEAIALFQSLCLTGTEPDEITMVGVLSSCASVGALDIGMMVEKLASEKGYDRDIYVGTALIDMYAKCGNLERATQIFHGMPWRNEVTWNAMIFAFAFHGRAQEALSLFKRLKDEQKNVKPDERTFLGVLSACVHAGLVDEGRKWFNYMENVSKISPQIEHYSCMVDLLARSGCVEEAWSFVQRIPGRPDAVMLGSLLSACKNCKNVEVGGKVLQSLMEMEPENSGNYVISSKMYANSRRWDDSAKMRGLMRDRGVIKTPGCSWIEISNQLHQFRSGDEFPLTAVEINQVIEMLNEELKIEGYRPDVNLV